ncbi:MAG: 50S ribosomal protein L37ae [Candidatus Woesearchaeota archaeon]|nr:50S ribosomal protein L37ae [Candidatus Woesearchaeota archaeon]
MPTKKLGLGPVKRFGTRYGRTTKMRLAAVEVQQKQAQQCPYCQKPKAHRLSYGIYSCECCGKKFTGPAYALTQKIRSVGTDLAVTKEEKTEPIIEA